MNGKISPNPEYTEEENRDICSYRVADAVKSVGGGEKKRCFSGKSHAAGCSLGFRRKSKYWKRTTEKEL